MKILMVVGAASKPGRLAEAILSTAVMAAGQVASLETEILNLALSPVEFCDGRGDDDYGKETRQAVAAAVAADAVVLASPVYRASYSGVLKNYLDLLPVAALRDKPVGIVAMGGSHHHYLGVDWQLRQVLSWFGALTLPNSVYLIGKDFTDGKLSSETASADLVQLVESLAMLSEARAERPIGPAPLAAKWA